MPPERSHAEASRLRARQSRIAKATGTAGPPAKALQAPQLGDRCVVGASPMHPSHVSYATRQRDARRRRAAASRRLHAGRRPRRARALPARRAVARRSRDAADRAAVYGRAVPARARRHLAPVLALLRLPGPGPRDRPHRPPRGRLGARPVPGRPRGRPLEAVYAQHSGAERCGCGAVDARGGRPVVFAAHGSHASYLRAGTRDRMWPDPNDEADGRGRGRRAAARRDHARPPGLDALPGPLGRLARALVDPARAGLAARPGVPAGPLGPGGVRRRRRAPARRRATTSASATRREKALTCRRDRRRAADPRLALPRCCVSDER